MDAFGAVEKRIVETSFAKRNDSQSVRKIGQSLAGIVAPRRKKKTGGLRKKGRITLRMQEILVEKIAAAVSADLYPFGKAIVL